MKKIIIIILLSILALLWYFLYEEVYNIKITEFTVPEKLYIIKGTVTPIDITIKEKNDKKINLKYISNDENILKTDGNKLTGINDGKTTLTIKTVNGEKKTVEIIVTSLITNPEINNDKPYITCNLYSKEEEKLLEEILENKIYESGYKTRGGVVAAARFLILEFKNKIKYFNENGRLENHGQILKIDGEGRFYHKGLYLTEDKYKIITSSTESGPAAWGCPLKNLYYNKIMENGLDCSGFITWVLFNAGFDIGDVGAGNFDYIHNELLDLTPKEEITNELLYSGKIKVGDLIGFDGHIGIIIGMDNSKIYIGESYETGLRAREFTKSELIKSEFTHIILMDDYYKHDGNYTIMW